MEKYDDILKTCQNALELAEAIEVTISGFKQEIKEVSIQIKLHKDLETVADLKAKMANQETQ